MVKHKAYKLKRELSLFETTLYGVGTILGAGIYALIGQGAAIGGNTFWLSFVLASVIAAFTGLSYAELSSMFPKIGAEYVYTKKAFNRRFVSFMVSWIFVIALIISASTVALGFAGYFTFLFPFLQDNLLVAAILIVLCSIVNYIGIKTSARFAVVSALIETGGLLIVIALGMFFIGSADVDYFALPESGLTGVIAATALIFFAYIGFEEVANISEETKNARKIIPKALVIALVISTVLYILVALSSLAIAGADALAASDAPLTEVVGKVLGPESIVLMSVIALFATGNTVLIILIVVSRIIAGVSRYGALPAFLSPINKRGTPGRAVFATMILAAVALFIGGIGVIALLTDVGIFVTYLFVNSSLIYLRYKKPKMKRPFRSPLNIGWFPVLAFLGLVSSAGILAFLSIHQPDVLIYEAVIIVAGVVAYKLESSRRKPSKARGRPEHAIG